MSRPYILVGCLILGACQSDAQRITEPTHPDVHFSEQSEVAPPDLVAERESLLEADRAHAARSASTNLVDGVVGMLAEDATIFVPTGVLQGREAIRARLALSATNRTSTLTWTPVRVDVSADGVHGYSYGYSEQTLADGRLFVGKYISYWKRASTGDWQVVAYKRLLREPVTIPYVAPAGFETPDYHHYRTFPPTDAATLMEDVMDTDRAFSALSATDGAPAAFAQFIAPDGAVLGPFAEIAFGTERVMASYEGAGPGALVWRPLMGDVAATGDLAFTIGDAEIRERREDGTMSDPIAVVWYLSIWKRQRTGEWRLVIDG